MRILIVGSHVSSAFFILSSMERVITNLIPPVQTDNSVSLIKSFVQICDQSYIHGAINIHNRSPWSEMINCKLSGEDLYLVERLDRMCGWKPDLILYIYSKGYELTNDVINLINSDIQICSLNADDRDFEKNLKTLIIGFQRRSPR
jgi:hypothetical protein